MDFHGNDKDDLHSCNVEADTEPLLPSLKCDGCREPSEIDSPDDSKCPPIVRVYRRRWLVLFLFSMLSFLQSIVWITWSAISISAKKVFHWNDTTIALLVDWGNIPFVIFMLPMCFLVQYKGLRFCTLFAAILSFLGTGLRCIFFRGFNATILIHLGQILNGIAGVVVCSVPALFSATWFPVEQRTTATSIGLTVNSLGIAAGFLVAPLFIREHTHNVTHWSSHKYLSNGSTNDTDDPEVEHHRTQIRELMFAEFIFASIVLLAILAYFPDKPPHPPSLTATAPRLNLRTSLPEVVKNYDFWVITLGYAVTNAICNNWLTVIGLALTPLDISQNSASLIGAISTVIGCFSALPLARAVDLIGGKIKFCLVVLWLIGLTNFVWFTLMYLKILPHGLEYIYPSVIITGVLTYSGPPLYMELASEVTYPVPEGIVGLTMQGFANLVGTIFLGLFLVPDIGVGWMNWVLIGSAFAAVILAAIQREKYGRSSIDRAPVICPTSINECEDT